MNIQFPNIHAVDPITFGISFPADVDGKKICCLVTIEALQDINPSRATDDAETQFTMNKYKFQKIAEAKIKLGEMQKGNVIITSVDVQ